MKEKWGSPRINQFAGAIERHPLGWPQTHTFGVCPRERLHDFGIAPHRIFPHERPIIPQHVVDLFNARQRLGAPGRKCRSDN